MNKFEFYNYEGRASQENRDSYMDFEQLNERMLDMRIALKKAGKIKTVELLKDDEGFSMLGEKQLTKYGPLIDKLIARAIEA